MADPGREFLGEFMKNAASLDIIFYQTANRAPWQQGKTERHGGHYKEMLARSRSELVITNRSELRALMIEVEQTKNRYISEPVWIQPGPTVDRPMATVAWKSQLSSDEGIDSTLLEGMLTDDIEQLHQLRRIAQKAFAEVNSKEVMQRALKGRSRPGQNFAGGDLVFVYCVPAARRRRSGERERFEVGTNKPAWVSSGTVLIRWPQPLGVNDGTVVASGQGASRPATTGEKMGVDALMQECRELVDEYRKSSHKQGYLDLTQQSVPPEAKIDQF